VLFDQMTDSHTHPAIAIAFSQIRWRFFHIHHWQRMKSGAKPGKFLPLDIITQCAIPKNEAIDMMGANQFIDDICQGFIAVRRLERFSHKTEQIHMILPGSVDNP
jgi:hypothetical protein